MTSTVSDPLPAEPEPPAETPGDPGAPGVEEAPPRGRPVGVVVVAVLVLALGVQALLVGFGVLEARYGSVGSFLSDPWQVKAWGIGLGVLTIYAALAMWLYRSSGWYVTTLLAGSGILLQIILYIWATPNYLSLGLWVATAFYLNQREVKARFLRPPTEATTVTLTVDRSESA